MAKGATVGPYEHESFVLSRRESVVFAFRIALAMTLMLSAPTMGQSAPPPQSGTSPPVSEPSSRSALAAAEAGELLLWKEMPTIVGAAKHEQKQREAPGAVTVITAREIELHGHKSLADVLRTQRGFFVHSDGQWSFLGVRGFLRPGEWNARVLVLVDGRPTREPVYGMTHMDRGMVVPIAAIQRIEIVRGPGSALYGSNAVFAVINIITRNGGDVKNWLELGGQIGTKKTFEGTTTLGRKFDNGWEFFVSAERYSSDGDRQIHYRGVHDADRNWGNLDDHDFEGTGDVFAKVRYRELTFSLDYKKRKKENRSATYWSTWDDPGYAEESRFNASVRWDHKIDDRRSLHTMAYYSRYDYRQPAAYDAGPPVGVYDYLSTVDADWLGADVHYDWQVTDRNRIVFGGEMMRTIRAQQRDWDTPWGLEIDSRRWARWWALYVQDEWSPTDWLTLTGGLRADVWGHFGCLVNPRAAAVFRPTKADTVKLLFGRAFRAPNLYEMYYTVAGTNVGNPRLEPEISDTYEAVWCHDFASGWQTELSYYYWRMKRTLVDQMDPDTWEIQTINDGVQQAQGIEGEVRKQWRNGCRLRVSGSIGRAVDEHHHRMTHSPDYLLGVSGTVPVLAPRTFLTAENQFVGSMRADEGSKSRPSYVTNLVLTRRDAFGVKGLDLNLGVYNLFGSQVEIPRNSPQDHSQLWLRHPGTWVVGGFRLRF